MGTTFMLVCPLAEVAVARQVSRSVRTRAVQTVFSEQPPTAALLLFGRVLKKLTQGDCLVVLLVPGTVE